MIKKTLQESMMDIITNWNDEYSNSYPLTVRIFNQTFLNSVHTDFEGSYSLYNEFDYIGTIVLKYYFGDDPKYKDNAYISFIYIKPKYRNQGFGTRLLNDAIKMSKLNNKQSLITGTDLDNFLSGVFVLNNYNTHQFFINHQFEQVSKNYNLICKQKVEISEDNFIYRTVKDEEEKAKVSEFVKKHFSLRWYNDVKDCSIDEFVIAIDKNEIIGFVRISDPSYPKLFNCTILYPLYNKLGGVGPLGVDPKMQGLGIGKRMVQHAINTLFNRGCSELIVDWTGLIDFYKKCGFEDISNQYIVYKYKL